MDAARLSAAKSSPMMETVNMVQQKHKHLWHKSIVVRVSVVTSHFQQTHLCFQCLQHLDVSVLGELVPRLCELLKSGVGLGTKVKPSLVFNAS